MYVTQGQEEMAELLTKAIGRRAHIKRNFVPCMLTCLAMDQALKACDEAAKARCSDVKKETRELRKAIKEYSYMLVKELGGKEEEFNALLYVFDTYTEGEQSLAELQSHADGKNAQNCPPRGALVAAHISQALALLKYVRDYDAETDRIVTEALKKINGMEAQRKTEPEMLTIKALLRKFESKGYKSRRSEYSDQWITVIANRASMLADEMIDKYDE